MYAYFSSSLRAAQSVNVIYFDSTLIPIIAGEIKPTILGKTTLIVYLFDQSSILN